MEQRETEAMTDETAEIATALRRALRSLAPAGGTRELHYNAASDAMVGVLAELLAAAPNAPAEIERLTALFRERLTEAVAERVAARGRRH